MTSKLKLRITRLGLPIFILVLGTVIFLKLIENKSIDSLVEHNTGLLNELESQNHFQKLQNDIATVEASIRDMSVSSDTTKLAGILQQMHLVDEQMSVISSDEYTADDNNPAYARLANLFTERIALQRITIDAYTKGNKGEMNNLLHSVRNRELRDSIIYASSQLFNVHQLTSTEIISSIRKDGSDVHMRSIALTIAACIACLLLSLYLVRKKRHSEASERKVKAAATVKENFLANMSHEIRTPLNAILGFTNILQKSKLDPQQQKHIQIIHSSGSNLLSIVNDILDLSKIEAGMMRIEEAPFRIKDIMSGVEQMLLPKAEEKNLKLIIKVDDEIPDTLSGDAVRLTQVVVNLVSNSIKFTEEGGVYVRVTPFKKTADTLSLEIHVRDTGIGIAKEKQKFIFERFEQAEAATTRRFGGTGLGLSIVKHLVDLQGGSVVLNSEVGYGTSFLVVLPYKTTNEIAPQITTTTITNKLFVMNNKSRVLIAEDNIMNQHLIRHLLNHWGFAFDLVGNGAFAVEALRKQHYDVVLMDIQMPEMDGHTAAKMIRSELKSVIPIIAMTAHAMAGEREKCISSGMNDYISKPIDEEALYQLLVKYSSNFNGKEDNGTETMGRVIDLQYIESVSDGDKQLKEDMIREFVKTVPGNIHNLEKAIDEKNYRVIYSIAHDLKTTVHFMGLTNLVGQSLQKIEDLASNNGTIATIRQMFEDVKAVCTRAVQEAGRLVA
jgi:signal transduction histidine kinase/CheY-like chemotaxis protein